MRWCAGTVLDALVRGDGDGEAAVEIGTSGPKSSVRAALSDSGPPPPK
jgi:hypothetical protein